MVEYKSESELTKYTPYLAITGEFCGIYFQRFEENWPILTRQHHI